MQQAILEDSATVENGAVLDFFEGYSRIATNLELPFPPLQLSALEPSSTSQLT